MTTCARSTDRKRDAERERKRRQFQAAGAAVLIAEFEERDKT